MLIVTADTSDRPAGEHASSAYFSSADDLRGMLREQSPEAFASHHVLDRTPYVFESRSDYIEWKSQLAAGLGVDPFAVLVVGSACTGISLNPKNGYSKFHKGSDIDVAVISPYHFDEAWKWFRALGSLRKLKYHSDRRRWLEWHQTWLIFNGTIATDACLEEMPFGAEWATALGRASRWGPIDGHDVKARVYRDFGALREYQTNNVRRLRQKVIVDGFDDLIEPLSVVGESESMETMEELAAGETESGQSSDG